MPMQKLPHGRGLQGLLKNNLGQTATTVLSVRVCSHFTLKPLCRRGSREQAGKDGTLPRDSAQGADQSRHPEGKELGTATSVQPTPKTCSCHQAGESQVQQDFPHAESVGDKKLLQREKSPVPALTSSSCGAETGATWAAAAASSAGG